MKDVFQLSNLELSLVGDDSQRRVSAVRCLSEIVSGDQPLAVRRAALRILIHAVQDRGRDALVRAAILDAIAPAVDQDTIGPTYVAKIKEALVAGLWDRNSLVRAAAADNIIRLARSPNGRRAWALAALRRALPGEPDEEVRRLIRIAIRNLQGEPGNEEQP